MKRYQNSNFSIRLPLFLAIAIALGIFIGANMAGGTGAPSSKKDWVKNITKFREILTNIEKNYVDDVDADELVETAINSMLDKLDPHSVYIPAKDLALAKSQLEGEFEGIGIEFNILKDTIYVVAPLHGGPSEKVGLQSGDKIIEVDEELVAGVGIGNRGVFDRLRGPKGSKVELKIKRNGQKELLDFTIERDKIPQYSVDVSYMVDEEIGYIKVSRFAATTYDEFKEALKGLKEKGMKKLILDLQGNPGGYMDRAINMADEFLPDNPMIVYTKGKEKKYDTEARGYRKGIFEQGPVIILIDEGSASASEIVAGAIQDNDRGLIVGRRSFGKGLVQMPISLSDGSELRLTISRYYTPSGRSIQKPYSEDKKQYRNDYMERFEHGEMFFADSIKFDDSLKYETKKGRMVYGGGGIMPDVFVPIDTSRNSDYYQKLFTSNSLREYTLKYYEENKAKLEQYDKNDFINNFSVSEKMLKELIQLAEQNKVKFKEDQYLRSKELIKLQVKAQLARSVWNNKGFYPIYNQINEPFQQALQLFDQAEELAKR